jgi:hypothetical protein
MPNKVAMWATVVVLNKDLFSKLFAAFDKLSY